VPDSGEQRRKSDESRRKKTVRARVKRIRETVIVSAAVGFALSVGTMAVLFFERRTNPDLGTFGKTFWYSLFSLMGNEPVGTMPTTTGGRISSAIIIFIGLVAFATITGTVSAFVGERLRVEKPIMDWDKLEGHLIICGWNRKAEIIVREYRDSACTPHMPIVVIAEFEGTPPFSDHSLKNSVQFLNDDFTKVEALQKAGVSRAAKCVILSDMGRGRKDRDADARTILAALTVEKLNHEVYTCAEINRREYVHHLELGNVNDYVVGGEHSAYLLAQAAITRGVMRVFTELLSYQHDNKFRKCTVSAAWDGKTFEDLLIHLKKEHDALLIGVSDEHGGVRINPTGHALTKGEVLVVIAAKAPLI
jgi:voltage-gated potassium channel